MIRIISIYSQYADRIRAGTKLFELRSYNPRIKPGTPIALYETKPQQIIQTVFLAGTTWQLTPDEAWDIWEPHLGIDFDSFFSYFRGKDSCFGISVEQVKTFSKLGLHHLAAEYNFHPPQGIKSWRHPHMPQPLSDAIKLLYQ